MDVSELHDEENLQMQLEDRGTLQVLDRDIAETPG